LTSTTAVTTSGVHGPIRMYTSTNVDSSNQFTEVILDDNPLFGNIKVYPAPPNITATIARDTNDTYAKYSSQSSTHTISLTGLNKINQPLKWELQLEFITANAHTFVPTLICNSTQYGNTNSTLKASDYTCKVED